MGLNRFPGPGTTIEWVEGLRSKIRSRKAVIGVIGLGYVGLPLSILFAEDFRVYGFDTNSALIKNLQEGNSHVDDVPDSSLRSLAGKSLHLTNDDSQLEICDFLIVSVPTPVTESNEPDLDSVQRAGEMVAKHLKRGQFVILESTTYPGTTRDLLVPTLESTGLRAGEDFGVAYSPERVDPGNSAFRTANTPKVVGGINQECTEIAAALFASVVESVVPVTSCEVAEASKMLENVFRAVNIALINEMTLMLDRLDIDVWEVIAAASTKPFGFMSFYPGPGIGGHCIPLDPFYMSYRAKQVGFITRFIELSGEINEFMKFHVVNLVVEGLQRAGKEVRSATISVFGLSYKRNIRDTREAPAKKIIEELFKRGCKIRVFDPIAKGIETNAGKFQTELSVEDALKGADALVLLTDHSVFEGLDRIGFESLMSGTPVIVDTRNLIKTAPNDSILIGLGKGKLTDTRRDKQSEAA